jgi:hypothetical protein
VERAYAEARATAAILAPFQAPRLSAVALGAVNKMIVEVIGGLPPRNTRGPPAIAPPATESGVVGPADAGVGGGVAGPEPDDAGGGRA